MDTFNNIFNNIFKNIFKLSKVIKECNNNLSTNIKNYIDICNSEKAIEMKHKLLKYVDLEFIDTGWLPASYFYRLSQCEDIKDLFKKDSIDVFDYIFSEDLLETLKYNISDKSEFYLEIVNRMINKDYFIVVDLTSRGIESFIKIEYPRDKNPDLYNNYGGISFKKLRNILEEQIKSAKDKKKSLLEHVLKIYQKNLGERHLVAHEVEKFYIDFSKKSMIEKKYLAFTLFSLYYYYYNKQKP